LGIFGRSDYNKQNSQIAVTFTDDGQTALLHDPLVLVKQGNFELYNRSVLFPNEFCSKTGELLAYSILPKRK
jgi:hypothetical protein